MKKLSLDYSKEHLLVLENDPKSRETLVRSLSDLGFRTSPATSAPDVLRMLQEDQYTFFLSDIAMPDSLGLEIIQKVAQNHPHVNILAMTSVPEGYPYTEVIKAGADDFIKKPFETGELDAKFHKLILDRDLRAELSALSITDSLTGLFNQRHFYNRLKEELARAKRQNRPLSLILLDLDDFKAYNDTHGHLAGDAVLRSFGGIIQRFIREGVDSGYRYGGDEFAIILTDADLTLAEEIWDRIQRALKKKDYNASMGYGKFTAGMTVKDLVAAADKGLYKAKLRILNNVG